MFYTSLLLFTFGAIVGTLGDYCHVISQTDGYLSPLAPLPTGQPFWVPLLFGSATLSIGLSHTWFDQWIGPKKRKIMKFEACLLANLAFFSLYAMSGYLPFETGGLRDVILFLGGVSVWLIFDRTWQGLLQASVTAMIGFGVEVLLTQIGAFYYYPHAANAMGVPSWLPWLYVAASVSVAQMARFLRTRLNSSF
jgi:hypothetical protein